MSRSEGGEGFATPRTLWLERLLQRTMFSSGVPNITEGASASRAATRPRASWSARPRAAMPADHRHAQADLVEEHEPAGVPWTCARDSLLTQFRTSSTMTTSLLSTVTITVTVATWIPGATRPANQPRERHGLFSAYHTLNGTKFWVITEMGSVGNDRSSPPRLLTRTSCPRWRLFSTLSRIDPLNMNP